MTTAHTLRRTSRRRRTAAALVVALSACSPGSATPPSLMQAVPPEVDGGAPATFGPVHAGSYHLGPVDFAQTQWTNSCAPYPAAVQQKAGVFLAGVDVSLNGDGSLCDACALVTTRLGKQVLVRITTTGVSKAPGDMDLSPEAFQAIHVVDEQGTPSNPRPMTWQLARCAGSGPVLLQYQTQANTSWTSLWVRNARLPVDSLEVKNARASSFTQLRRETDGTFNADRGFGEGSYTLRLTGRGGVTATQDFSGFTPGALVETMMRLE